MEEVPIPGASKYTISDDGTVMSYADRRRKDRLGSVKSVNGYTFAWSADDEIDNKDNIVKAQSTTSDIIGIAKSLLNFIIGKSEKREEKRDKIMKQIEGQKEELKKALSEGRISDAGSISSTISKLYKKFNKVGLFSAIALCFMLSGCKTIKLDPEYNQPLVLGERVFICQEKDIIEIPALVPPATKWYLVDNIGLTQWLGIPANQQP